MRTADAVVARRCLASAHAVQAQECGGAAGVDGGAAGVDDGAAAAGATLRTADEWLHVHRAWLEAPAAAFDVGTVGAGGGRPAAVAGLAPGAVAALRDLAAMPPKALQALQQQCAALATDESSAVRALVLACLSQRRDRRAAPSDNTSDTSDPSDPSDPRLHDWPGLRPTDGVASTSRVTELRHTTSALPQSLTLQSDDHSALAVRAFQSVMGFMGDRSYGADDGLAAALVHLGLSVPPLRDELLLQVLKQLHRNPSSQSLRKGQLLLFLLLSTFPPLSLDVLDAALERVASPMHHVCLHATQHRWRGRHVAAAAAPGCGDGDTPPRLPSLADVRAVLALASRLQAVQWLAADSPGAASWALHVFAPDVGRYTSLPLFSLHGLVDSPPAPVCSLVVGDVLSAAASTAVPPAVVPASAPASAPAFASASASAPSSATPGRHMVRFTVGAGDSSRKGTGQHTVLLPPSMATYK